MCHKSFRESLAQDLETFEISNYEDDANYLSTDKLFRDFFKDRVAVEDLTPDDAKIAAVIVYSWMGQGKLNSDCWGNFERAKNTLRALRSKEVEINASSFADVQSFLGSLVATSKFLYFFDPERFAIWDRHVGRAVYGYNDYRFGKENSIQNYLCYLKNLKEQRIPDPLLRQARKILGPDASGMRIKEYVLFRLGKSKQEDKSSTRGKKSTVAAAKPPVSRQTPA